MAENDRAKPTVNRKTLTLGGVLAAVVVALIGFVATTVFGVGESHTDQEATASVSVSVPSSSVSSARESGFSDLPTITVGELPQQARETIALIDDGGPFPYSRDGVVFGNREGLLPSKERGYYREYTVPTPGENDRGARRLVTGRAGELYYTDDHYQSFREVLR